MNEQQQHEMTLEKTHPSGTEEWNCPTCGRRLLVDWKPKFKKTVLKIGDEYAMHSGGKGGLRMGPMKIMSGNDTALQEEPEMPIEDTRLAPWVKWLEEVGFESLWNSNV